jgi:ATP-binding cassette subfamily B multidrug efflux pump
MGWMYMKQENTKIKFAPPENKDRILSYIKKHKRQFLITAISGIFFNSAIVLGPIFQGKLLDAAVNAANINYILKAALEFVGVTLAFQIARFFKRYYGKRKNRRYDVYHHRRCGYSCRSSEKDHY